MAEPHYEQQPVKAGVESTPGRPSPLELYHEARSTHGQREAVMYHLGRLRVNSCPAVRAGKLSVHDIVNAIMREVLTPEVGSFNGIGNIVDGYIRHELKLELEAPVAAEVELKRLQQLIDTPYTADWVEGVKLEAAHQIKRWGTDHDEGKEPSDWYWLLGWLAGKALMAVLRGDLEKAKHHTISSGAVLLNWHRRMCGEDFTFQPGMTPPE